MSGNAMKSSPPYFAAHIIRAAITTEAVISILYTIDFNYLCKLILRPSALSNNPLIHENVLINYARHAVSHEQ
jgi:hypothetical protein